MIAGRIETLQQAHHHNIRKATNERASLPKRRCSCFIGASYSGIGAPPTLPGTGHGWARPRTQGAADIFETSPARDRAAQDLMRSLGAMAALQGGHHEVLLDQFFKDRLYWLISIIVVIVVVLMLVYGR